MQGFLLPVALLGLLIVFAFLPMILQDPKPANASHEQIEIERLPADINTITVNVQGVDNAFALFTNGNRNPLPIELQGREGEKVKFSIIAEGYIPKEVDLIITSRRHAYEFTLEKEK